MFMPDLPAIMLTYDFYDRAEASAVRALAGEIADRRPAADRAARLCEGRRGPRSRRCRSADGRWQMVDGRVRLLQRRRCKLGTFPSSIYHLPFLGAERL